MTGRRITDSGPCGADGFSLLELLVATLCTTLLCSAVFALLVGSASAARREWASLAARRAANAAVAALAHDLGRAGAGLEQADAVARDGARIPFASAAADGSVRMVLADGRPREIRGHHPGAGYVVDGAAGLRVGDIVAAIDMPDRPAGAPLPIGTVFVAGSVATGLEVRVAWGAAEAAELAAWGPPRALLPVMLRTYSTRRVDGKLQLDRRNDDGARQPVVDGLEEVRVDWLVDTDADGLGDTVHGVVAPAPGSRLCAARIIAVATPLLRRTVGAGEEIATVRAERWVSLPAC